jgi:hypothetical protein
MGLTLDVVVCGALLRFLGCEALSALFFQPFALFLNIKS